MYRIALGIEYDGSFFHGWQYQLDKPSVQAALEKALSLVADEPIKTICAGRTDAGVHATAQVVHFETKVLRRSEAWVFGVNAELDPAVRVLWAIEVPSTFNARRSALGRKYRYLVYNHPLRPSLMKKRVTWVYRKLDIKNMIEAAQYWLGEHDFSSFRAAQCQSKSPIRHIKSIDIIEKGHYLILDIAANAFLHHMVRNMAGVLIAIGTGKMKVSWAKEVLMARDRRQAGMTAPAEGLYLIGVEYPSAFGLPSSGEDPWILY